MGDSKRYLGFQAKVLIPVVSVLLLFLAIMMWLVNRRLTDELEQEAVHTLTVTDAVFRSSFQIRTRNLLLRYQTLVNEPRFKAVAQLAEPKTMTAQLMEILDEIGGDATVVIFTTENNLLLGGAHRDARISLQEFQSRSSAAILKAWKDLSGVDTVIVQGRLLNVISVPVFVGDSMKGVLTIGVSTGATTAQELKLLTRSEIAFITNETVTASTLKNVYFYPQLDRMFVNLMSPSAKSKKDSLTIKELITPDGEHFLCLANRL